MSYNYAGWSENLIPAEVVEKIAPEEFKAFQKHIAENNIDTRDIPYMDKNVDKATLDLVDAVVKRIKVETRLDIELTNAGGEFIESSSNEPTYWRVNNAYTMNPNYSKLAKKYEFEEWQYFVTGG